MQPPSQIDHLGIAVHSIEEASRFYRDVLGLECGGSEEVPDQKVRVVFFQVGEVRIELLEPTAADSPIARFLEKKGPGLHHIAYRVDDLPATLAALEMAPEGDRPYMTVLLTDGKPTVGETEPPLILEKVGEANKRNVRVFTFGIAEQLDVALLDQIAKLTRSYSDYLAPGREIEAKIDATEETLRLPVTLGPVVIDPASGTFLLQLELDNRQERLVPGVSGRIASVDPPLVSP